MALTHPYLLGTALDRMEDEPLGPVDINVSEYDIGDDLMKGINDIDGARHLVSHSRH
jgi:hypothetical protein